MPITLNSYTYLRLDGDLTIPQRTGKPRFVYPFQNDLSIYNIEEDYKVFIDFYEPLTPVTPHPDYSSVYYIKDSPISDTGGGIGQFTRTWGLLPGYGDIGKRTGYVFSIYESFVFQVPGINNNVLQDLFQQYLITGKTVNADGNWVLTSNVPHDVQPNHGALIWYHVVDPLNHFTYERSVVKMALAGTGGSTLIIPPIVDINTPGLEWFQRSETKQDPYQKTITSRVDTDFWLPGVNCKTVNDIPTISAFKIIDSTGNKSDYLNDLSTPNLSTYLNYVNNGSWIVAEDSQITLYQGDMYKRSTRYIKAVL